MRKCFPYYYTYMQSVGRNVVKCENSAIFQMTIIIAKHMQTHCQSNLQVVLILITEPSTLWGVICAKTFILWTLEELVHGIFGTC